MGSGGGSTPQPVKPGESTQAAVGAAGAGEMMSIADQPVEQYANLATASQLGPAEQQTQTALQNQAALQSAQAQMDIMSRVDPLAYQQRQMRLQAATNRIGQLTNQTPSAFTANFPGAYQVGDTSQVGALSDLARQGRAIASNLAIPSVSSQGTNPQLNYPKNPQNVTPYSAPSYLG